MQAGFDNDMTQKHLHPSRFKYARAAATTIYCITSIIQHESFLNKIVQNL